MVILRQAGLWQLQWKQSRDGVHCDKTRGGALQRSHSFYANPETPAGVLLADWRPGWAYRRSRAVLLCAVKAPTLVNRREEDVGM